MKKYLVILFAGRGQRFSKNIPKQFYKIDGETIFEKTINNWKPYFEKFEQVIVVINKNYKKMYKKIDKLTYIDGGNTRYESLANAVNFIKNNNKDENCYIISHDGARFKTSNKIIEKSLLQENNFSFFKENFDSILDIKQNIILERENIVNLETPQGFFIKDFINSKKVNSNVNDIVSLFLNNNIKINYIKNDETNIKLTTKNDLLND